MSSSLDLNVNSRTRNETNAVYLMRCSQDTRDKISSLILGKKRAVKMKCSLRNG